MQGTQLSALGRGLRGSERQWMVLPFSGRQEREGGYWRGHRAEVDLKDHL